MLTSDMKTAAISETTLSQWCKWLAAAAQLGGTDEITEARERTGMQVAETLKLRSLRTGHVRALRHAYMAGRFHIRAMGRED